MLKFGYNAGLPEDVEVAWGCRAIVDQQGTVDVVPDRVDAFGPDTARGLFLDYLRDVVGEAPFDMARKLLIDYTMRTREAEEFVLYEDFVCKVLGNTNGSAGYLYVAAFPKPGATLKRYVAERVPITAERWEKVYGWPRVDAEKMADSGSEVRVHVEDETGRRELEHHVKHSPTGFEFGYNGSGPADLARCVVIDALEIGHHRLAAMEQERVEVPGYQDVKAALVASAPHSARRHVIYAQHVLDLLALDKEAAQR